MESRIEHQYAVPCNASCDLCRPPPPPSQPPLHRVPQFPIHPQQYPIPTAYPSKYRPHPVQPCLDRDQGRFQSGSQGSSLQTQQCLEDTKQTPSGHGDPHLVFEYKQSPDTDAEYHNTSREPKIATTRRKAPRALLVKQLSNVCYLQVADCARKQACNSCRYLKAKCDEKKPCKNCKEKDRKCIYPEQLRRY